MYFFHIPNDILTRVGSLHASVLPSHSKYPFSENVYRLAQKRASTTAVADLRRRRLRFIVHTQTLSTSFFQFV